MITLREGMLVYVYRNLKHGRKTRPLYSVLYKRKVIARLHRVLLSSAHFNVREAGRKRYLRTGRKNVHAFVVGRFTGEKGAFGIDAETHKDLPVHVKYDPQIAGYFFEPSGDPRVKIGRRIDYARAVLLNERGISACYIGG